ncbi:hypothetical protein V8F06_010034 [Rhypophila decipiens]
MHYMSPMTNRITRLHGKDNDLFTEAIASKCCRSDQFRYGYSEWHNSFISCAMEATGIIKGVDIRSGATLAGLLPTNFILISMEPLDMLKKGFIARHRTLAIPCFPISLPAALFARLEPVRHGICRSIQSDSIRPSTPIDMEAATVEKDALAVKHKAPDSRTVTQEIHFAVLSTTYRWIHSGIKGFADLSITALSGVMVYKNWLLNLLLMVPWKYETLIMTLAFAWTLLSMFWMLNIMLLFFSLHHDMRFGDADNHGITPKSWEALIFPYTLRFKPNEEGIKS